MGAEIISQGLSACESGGVLRIGKQLCAIALEDCLFCGQRAGFLVLSGQLASFDFAGFDVGLIEGVDPDDGSSDGGGDLPAEKFLAEVVSVADRNANHWMSGGFEGGNFGVLRGVGGGIETNIRKNSVAAVARGSGGGPARHGGGCVSPRSRGCVGAAGRASAP